MIELSRYYLRNNYSNNLRHRVTGRVKNKFVKSSIEYPIKMNVFDLAIYRYNS